MRIIVSGGGTGGHIYPAVTIIRHLQELAPTAEFLYVGTKHGLEADIIPKENLPLATIDIQGFEHHITPKNFKRAGKALIGVTKAAKIVRRFKPDVAIGTGGYVCGPILLAASLMHVPTLIQEQNVIPGITNRILSRFVTKIAVGTPEAMHHFPAAKTVLTGNPIRKEVLSARREDGLKEFGFDERRRIVLVSGGSRGARSINEAMIGILAEAAKTGDVQILHVTGKAEYDSVREKLQAAGVDLVGAPHIKVCPYLYNMPAALAMADLAVFRAGAIGLAELTARGIPAILVPYPYASENHQEHNARALASLGAAHMILNEDLTTESLGAAMKELLTAEGKLGQMAAASLAQGHPQAAAKIAGMVLDMMRQKP